MSMAACSQCGKPAVVGVGDNPLCVDCLYKFQQAILMRDRMLKEEVNFLIGQMEAVSGIYGLFPRYALPEPVIHQGSMNFHNIKVDRSVVGAINTGNVKRIDVALDNIQANSGDASLQQALKEFTEALLNEASLTAAAKNEVLEQLAVVAGQAAMPKESRSWGILKALVTNIGTQVATTGLAVLWDAIRPMLGL